MQVAIYRCLLDIAAGMDYLHSIGVLHGEGLPHHAWACCMDQHLFTLTIVPLPQQLCEEGMWTLSGVRKFP